MCSAIEYQGQRLYFKDQEALPILRRDGGVDWVPWGQPYALDTPGVPSGACARRESLLAGKWKRLKPRPVKILCTAFMERDAQRQEHWFPLADSLAMQGALILLDNPIQTKRNGAFRAVVYVVTEAASGAVAAVHDRQPRLIPR